MCKVQDTVISRSQDGACDSTATRVLMTNISTTSEAYYQQEANREADREADREEEWEDKWEEEQGR